MPEVGRQKRHACHDVGPVLIPAKQGPHGKAVAQVMRAGPALRRAEMQPRTADELKPGEVRVAVEEPGAGSRDEERPVGGVGAEPVAATRVGSERLERAGVQRDLSGLPVMRISA